MSTDPEIVSSVGRFRTSVILLVGSAAATFYSTQILLDIETLGKNLPTAIGVVIALAGIAFFAAGCWTLYSDWGHEKKLKTYTEDIRKEERKQRQIQSKELMSDHKEEANSPPKRTSEEDPVEDTEEYDMEDL